MINIAEFEKIKLGKQVTLKQFIEKGIEVCNNINLIVYDDVFDKIQVEYYVFIVTEVLTKSKKKWLAAKDATASYCQHLIKILGPNNINSYKLCNLDSLNTWYDTYTFIIDSFLITQELIFLKENDVKKWLSRKLLKKTIMTEAYGISFLNAKKEYFLNNQSEFLNKEQLNELNIVFKSFFKYLETNVLLFKQSPKKIINSVVGNNLYEINLKGGETTNLNYFRKKIFQKSYYFNGKRTTKQEAKLTSIQDLPKIKIALRANYVQLQESSVARIIVLKTGCPVVHDCFTIDYFNIPFLVSEVNVAMNLEFHDLGLHKNDFIFFSIFIIL